MSIYYNKKKASFQSTFSHLNESPDHFYSRFILQVNPQFRLMAGNIICPTYQAIVFPVVMEIRASFKVTAVIVVILS